MATEPTVFKPKQSSRDLYRWFDERMGLQELLQVLLDEPIPGGARYAYVFGSALLAVFLLQILTGIALLFYYTPSVDHAHTSVAYIMKMVTAGSFIRGLHVYGASAMIILLVIHLIQTFFYGSYKGRRELQWISGFILFSLYWAWDSRVICCHGTRKPTSPPRWEPMWGRKFRWWEARSS